MNEEAIDRKLVCAFIDGLISDEGEREKGLEYIRNMPPVETHDKRTETHACDYIHRQDVLDLAKKGVLISNGNYGSVCKAINELPPVNPTKTEKWIPVSEPPKELGTYLVQTDGEPYMCQCRWTDVNPFWTDFKTKPHWNIFDLPQYSKVVAWMPLPEPYEPQERSGEE